MACSFIFLNPNVTVQKVGSENDVGLLCVFVNSNNIVVVLLGFFYSLMCIFH